MIEKIKTILALFCNTLGLSKLYYIILNRRYKNNYVRVINYHDVLDNEKNNFEKQIELFSKYYQLIGIDEFKLFLNDNTKHFNGKPALLITFDDGKANNYEASKLLDNKGIKAVFFVSSEKVDNEDQDYLKISQLKDMISNGHYIGNHTNSHHRFSLKDKEELIRYELLDSNEKLKKLLSINNDCFCWCGGETNVYTKEAFDVVRNNYKYCFTTCTQITTQDTNPLMINRTNIEARWNLTLTKFQVLGLWDLFYKKKEKKVKEIIGL